MRAMKDSGIEWIGEIPLGWEIRRIKSIGTYRNGLTYSPNDLVGEGEGTLVFRSSNIQNGALSLSDNVYVSCKIPEFLKVKQGDILICSRNGSKELIGKNAIIDIDGDYSFGAFMMIFRCANPRYIYYILNSSLFTYYLNSFLTSTVNQLTAENFGNMKFAYCPDIDGQNRIVSFLDAKCAEIDALIAAKEKTNALLKERRQSIIHEAVTKGLDPSVPMKDSGVEWIGEIPEGWKIYRFKYLLNSGKDAIKAGPFGSSLTSVDMQGNDVKVFTQRTVLDNDFESGNEFVSEEKSKELKGFMATPGDILITTRGTIGKAAIVPSGKRGILHPCLIKMSIAPALFSKELLCRILNETSILTEQLRLASNATTIDVIYTQNLLNIFIPVPPIAEQVKIETYLCTQCSAIDNLLFINDSTVKKLKEYRNSLIYEAVTGKIEV